MELISKCWTRFFQDVFEAISNFPIDDKLCNLVVDGMAIRKQIVWDSKADKFIGYCDFGKCLNLNDDKIPASDALVFMLCSIKSKWKWPIGYIFYNKIDSTALAELLRSALCLSATAGVKVVSVTCDGTIVNFTAMNNLGCKLFV